MKEKIQKIGKKIIHCLESKLPQIRDYLGEIFSAFSTLLFRFYKKIVNKNNKKIALKALKYLESKLPQIRDYLGEIFSAFSVLLFRFYKNNIYKKTKLIIRLIKTDQINIFGKIILLPYFIVGQKGLALILIFSILLSSFSFGSKSTSAATYNWVQTSWEGGLDSGNYAEHTSTGAPTDWDKYASSSNEIYKGIELTLSPIEVATTSTTQRQFVEGIPNQTVIVGTGTESYIKLKQQDGVEKENWSLPAPNSPADSMGNYQQLVYPGFDDTIYWFSSLSLFERYSITNNTYATSSSGLLCYLGTGSAVVYVESQNALFYTCGGGTTFNKYNLSTSNNTSLTTVTNQIGQGGNLIYPGTGDFIYAIRGQATNNFYRYSINGNSWTTLTNIPSNITPDSGAVYVKSNNSIYLTDSASSNIYKYSIDNNNWTTTSTDVTFDSGTDLIYPGYGDFIYASLGASSTFLKFNINNYSTTTILSSIPNINFANEGKRLIYGPKGLIWAITASVVGRQLYTYDIDSNLWNHIESSLPGGATFTGNADQVIVDDKMYAAIKDKTYLYIYDFISQTWSTSTNQIPDGLDFETSGSVLFDSVDDNTLYIIPGGGFAKMYKYNITSGEFSTTTDPSISFSTSGSATFVASTTDRYIYHINNNAALRRYSINNDNWTDLNGNITIGSSAELYYPGIDNYLYLVAGNGTTKTYRYDIANDLWDDSAFADTPENAGAGTTLSYPGDGDYMYFLPGNDSRNFYKYSIDNNNWTQLSSTIEASYGIGGGASLYYHSDKKSFYTPNGRGILDILQYKLLDDYYSFGDYESGIIDVGSEVSFNQISWNEDTPSGTSVKFKISSAPASTTTPNVPDDDLWTEWLGPTGIGDFYETSSSTINSVHTGHRFIKYKVFLESNNSEVTPKLYDVTITYGTYPTGEKELWSSVYNTGSDANIVAGIKWTENLPTDTSIKFQVRTAPASTTATSTPDEALWTDWLGPTGTSTYYTNSAGETMNTEHTTGGDDRFVQYRVFLSTTNTVVTPTIYDITLSYVVNSPPDFEIDYPSAGGNGSGAGQATTTGKVVINYSVRDEDTATDIIMPSFQYSTDDGDTWFDIATSTLEASDYTAKTVASSTYTIHSANWDVSSVLSNSYIDTMKIKVIADDEEDANNIASSTTDTFTIDTEVPVLTSSSFVIATSSPAILYSDVIDDSSIYMKFGTESDLSGSDWEVYNDEVELTSLVEGQTVYVQFRDLYQNTTSIYTINIPAKPANIYFQDITNTDTSDYQLFISWGVASTSMNPSFEKYNIYRSVDGGSYDFLASSTSRTSNYYVDKDLDTNTEYSYKVSVENSNGSVSFFSDSTDPDKPDGIGGSDLTPPTISNVTSSDITTTNATISWNADEISNSYVYYVATTTFPGSDKADYLESAGIPTMILSGDDHIVTLSGLTPNTQYYFLVESQDPSDNNGQSALPGYTFTTNAGPIITTVSASTILDEEAYITWNTNVLSDSVVVYSTSTSFSNSTEISSTDDVIQHSVYLPNLTRNTLYYYYVKSTDQSNNEAVDKNVIDNEINYYNFRTTQDNLPPGISDVNESLIGETGVTITWTTDEPATSQIEWGTTDSLGTYTTETSVYTKQHAVVLTGLSNETTYYYRVISKDASENEMSDDNSGNTYSFATLAPTVVTVTTRSGGGGSSGRDRSAPIISDIKVEAASGNTAVISFNTSEVANGQIKYSTTTDLLNIAGNETLFSTGLHTVTISGLSPLTKYYYIATASDVAGNVAESSVLEFTTAESGTQILISDEPVDFSNLSQEEQDLLANVEKASSEAVRNIFTALSNNPNLAAVSETSLVSSINSLMSKVVDAPAIAGTDIKVEVGARNAVISWTTDKPSNSLVAYSSASEYDPSTPDKYTITAGFPDESETTHKVSLENLNPGTTYHFQVRSQGLLGPVALSSDRTFKTKLLTPEIIDLRFNEISETGIRFSWKTEIPTKTTLELTNSDTGEISKIATESFLTDHSQNLDSLDPSANYNLRIIAIDTEGMVSNPFSVPFSTTLSNEPPVISNLRITTSIIPDRVDAAQTIISWKTNKPSTSQILFVEGSGSEFTGQTKTDPSLVRDHVVITTALKPGSVYKIVARSNDIIGNVSDSNPYTVLTPKSKASIIDIIFENLEETFGFLQGK